MSFHRARYIDRDLVLLFVRRYPIIQAVDGAMKEEGFRVMFLLRLCPLVPFNSLNYIGGITGLEFSYFFLSLIGILPSLILTVVLGAEASNLRNNEDEQKSLTIALIIITLVFGVVGLTMLWYFARKKLKQYMTSDRAWEDIDSAMSESMNHTDASTETNEIWTRRKEDWYEFWI